MRNHWIAAVAALALLGGCNSADQQAAGQQAAAPGVASGSTITGKVTLREPMPIGAGAKLDVKLVDVAEPGLPVAEKAFDVSGAPPYTFSLDFDRSKVSAGRTYVVNALLIDGPRRFVPALNSPVLTHGAGTSVEVVLNTEATPAEKLADECGKLENHIGGMKTVNGTYTTEDSSVGWDAFAQGGTVRYVRVNTDFDKGGHTSANYAYKDGQPMCAKQPGGIKAKWNVGWGDGGDVLFSNKAGGGELDEAAIAEFREAAMKALAMAQAKLDAGRKK
ncbi:MAG: YbaY family lipoprotein [Xanthomonadales bacterium]|nr:YbaY family lipoprotein [Xanthomonadales bacterium]